MSVLSPVADLVAAISGLLEKPFGASATAAAVVLCTALIRLALHPLARAAVRGERIRAELAPELSELQHRHRDDPERLRQSVAELQARRGASPLAGCLPALLQLPVFFALYHLFTRDEELLDHALLGAPLGGRWADALHSGGVLGADGLVYLGLFGVSGTVAAWTALRARRSAAYHPPAPAPDNTRSGRARSARAGSAGAHSGGARPGAGVLRLLPLLSFGTLVTAALVPLAAGLYLATTTLWTAVERALLGAGRPTPSAKSGPAPEGGPSANGRPTD